MSPESSLPEAVVQPVRMVTGQAFLLAGLRRWHAFKTASQSIPEQWQEFAPQLPLPGQQGRITYGALCGVRLGEMEYLSGVEVDDFAGLPAGMGRMRIRPQHYAVFWHAGPIQTIGQTWTACVHTWLPASEFDSAEAPDFERYDERYDPATGLGGVEIWVAVIPRVLPPSP
jgi:AraC family transcriptional regulator